MEKDMMMGAMNPKFVKGAMNASMLTKRDERGIPLGGVVKESTKPNRANESDAAILNFALALEYLEADFYNRVVQADTTRSFLKDRVKDLARTLQRDENTHVQAVSDTIRRLGGTPIAKPEFVFPQSGFVSPIGFLVLSSQLEETGVMAYLGQGARVKREDVLNFAASIYGNEARHSGLIRYHLGDSIAPTDNETPMTMEQILAKVRPFFASPGILDSMMSKP